MLLEVSGLSKNFGKIRAVDDLSFSVEEGEIVGLVGPNGSGKTTTLKCVTSILNASAGRIVIEGHDLYQEPEKAKRNIAYIPEMPELLIKKMTVVQNIQFAAKMYFHEEWRETAVRLMKGFDLDDKGNRGVAELSKGEKQKTAIICAFVHEPKLIFLDEPLIGIDPKGVRLLKDLLREHRAKGGSALISSHMLDLIEELCDRVIVINEGKKIVEGTISEIEAMAVEKAAQKADTIDDVSEDYTDFEDVFIKITEREPGEEGEDSEE